MTCEEAAKILDGAEVMILNRNLKQFNRAIIMAIDALRKLGAQEQPETPCDMCRYNPPSSRDGKPCTLCPASPVECYGEDV